MSCSFSGSGYSSVVVRDVHDPTQIGASTRSLLVFSNHDCHQTFTPTVMLPSVHLPDLWPGWFIDQ